MAAVLGRAQCLAAIFLVCPAPVLGAGQAWWYYEYERDFVQSLHIMVFVLLALGFEGAWHKAKHYVKDTFYFGMHFRHDWRDPAMTPQQHRQLMAELVDRMGGEFMTLGFVAFIIFVLNNVGFFDFLGEEVNGDDNFKLPAESLDWLHEAEIAHMKLFLAMLFYFVVTSGLIQAAIQKLRKYEILGVQHARQSSRVEISERNWSLLGLTSNLELTEYHGMRSYLLTRVGEWKYRRPERFVDLCVALKVDPEEDTAQKRLREVLDARINFSAYIAGNLGEGVCESIHLHFTTWIGIEVIFALFAAAHWAEVPQTTVIPFFAVMAVMMMISMWWASRQHKDFVLNYRPPKRERDSLVRQSQSLGRRSSKCSSNNGGGGLKLTPRSDHHVAGATVAGHVQSGTPTELEMPETPRTGEPSWCAGQRSIRTSWTTTGSNQTAASRLSNEESIHTVVNTERSVMRCLQTFTFAVCFVCADSVLNAIFPGGLGRSVWDIISVPVLLIVVAIITHLQRIVVPRFLVLMALPPFVNEQNFEVLLSVTISQIPEEVFELGVVYPPTPSTALSKVGESFQGRASEVASENEHAAVELSSLVGKLEGAELFPRQRSAGSSSFKAEATDIIKEEEDEVLTELDAQHGQHWVESI